MLYQLSYAPIGFKPSQLGPLHGAKFDSSVFPASSKACHPERFDYAQHRLRRRTKDEKGDHLNV